MVFHNIMLSCEMLVLQTNEAKNLYCGLKPM